jgi:ubiquinone/menaquinone biosynthesis C-methylase UbiE
MRAESDAEREFWEHTARRFGQDPLAAVTAPTATSIVLTVRDFFQAYSLRPIFRRLAGESLLEIGCGNGRWMHRAAKLGVRPIGVDLSSEMISTRRHQFNGIVADASSLPFRESFFSSALTVTVLQHILSRKRLNSVISEIDRVLRVEGRLFFLETSTTNECMDYVARDYPTAFRSLQSWKRILSDSGFQFVEVLAVNPSIEAHFLNAIKERVIGPGARLYDKQLRGQLNLRESLLKALWDIATSTAILLFFPWNFILRRVLLDSSIHKIMVFAKVSPTLDSMSK